MHIIFDEFFLRNRGTFLPKQSRNVTVFRERLSPNFRLIKARQGLNHKQDSEHRRRALHYMLVHLSYISTVESL